MTENESPGAETYFQVQQFLFREAALIDSWQLDEWLSLYAADAEYQVPPTDLSEDSSPENSLYYIADDRRRLEERVLRLNKKTAHSEYPRSKLRHLVSNIRILEAKQPELSVDAAFVCYRSKDGVTDAFIGRYEYQLVRTDEGLKIRSKRCHLDMDGLRPHGRISIIL
jgi:p-cumate 2,3-dioxygenase subunit beta